LPERAEYTGLVETKASINRPRRCTMPIHFGQKFPSSKNTAPQSKTESTQETGGGFSDQPASGDSSEKQSPSFLKRGDQAKQALEQERARREAQEAERGGLFRFWMSPEQDRRITFLDGELDEDGMLDVPMYYEHTVRVAGRIKNYVCVGDQEPCPICQADEKAALVGVMTIIDHTPHKIKRGQNAGKEVRNQRKLFVAKQTTLQTLTKIANKRGGLTGCTFEVSRADDRSPGVGSQFDFEEKHDTLEQVAQKYGLSAEDVVPADYSEEIHYFTADELVRLGAGSPVRGPGIDQKVDQESLENEL